LEDLTFGEGAITLASKEVEVAGPAAGEDVEVSVAVEVHQLWSEADASARGNLAVEPRKVGKHRLRVRPGVAIDAKLAVPELAHEQVFDPIPIEVAEERGRVTNVHVDRLAASEDAHRRGEVRRFGGSHRDRE